MGHELVQLFTNSTAQIQLNSSAMVQLNSSDGLFGHIDRFQLLATQLAPSLSYRRDVRQPA